MKSQDRSITYRNSHSTIRFSLHMMRKDMQNPNPTRHLQPRLHLHRRPHPESVQPVGHRRPHILRLGHRHRKRLDGEGRRHVLGPAGADLAGGDEHEPYLAAGVEELESAVVVGEDGAVRVCDGDVLGEGEVNGGVGEGK